MNYEEQLYQAIEKENIQYKKILNSNEYKIGKKICILKDILKSFNIKIIFKKIKNIHNDISYKKKLSPKNKNDKKFLPYDGDKKIVVYTCITGNYDNMLNPLVKEQKCDYVLFTDSDISTKNEENGYKVLDIPDNIKEKKFNNILLNRYIKMHPHELFENKYDYAIYLDGNIRSISNISSFINEVNDNIGIAMHRHCCRNCIYEESKILKMLGKGNSKYLDDQTNKYEQDKFPHNYGMLEANVIVTDLHNSVAKKIFTEWWNEFTNSKSLRDQISLPYILWKNGISIDVVANLGNNVYDNPKLLKINHKKII